MSQYDLMIRGATLVLPTGEQQADIAITDGRIVAIEAELSGSSREAIDAHALHIFPGLIDAHVHFNEPGRSEWEGFATGTRALAAGGTCAFFDMPLNAHPPTIDARSFDLKYEAARSSSLVDFALWGGLVPGNLAQLDELAERGVIGLKAFMSNSGIDDFSSVDDLTLYEGMARAAQLGLLVAVHAENDQITSALAQRAQAEGRTGIRDYLASRPIVAELEAIERAILFAGETGCALHIVHVSTGRGVSMVLEAQQRGIDVSCETCAHYLFFTEEDVERIGALAKCAPPLRSASEQEALWQHIFASTLPIVTTDHSPAPASMKTDSNFFKVWGGISGCQSLLSTLLTVGWEQRKLALSSIAALTADNVAHRFGLAPTKGRIAIGADADLVLVDLSQRVELRTPDLYYRHQHSPYTGYTFRGKVIRTLVRGQTVFHNGTFSPTPVGRLLKGHPHHVGHEA